MFSQDKALAKRIAKRMTPETIKHEGAQWPRAEDLPPIPSIVQAYKLKPIKRKLAIFDCETDPFEYGVIVKPFTCGLYDGDDYVDFWGDDCIEQFAEYMQTRRSEKLLIYAHNLGGFDGHFLGNYFDDDERPTIIGGRIVKVKIFGQEWRDSVKILPVKLSQMQKEEFDYMKNKREVRELHKDEILKYQKSDCLNLYEPVNKFLDMFGDRLTIGATAINMLGSFHYYEKISQTNDEMLRPYFHGGRTQAFEKGVLEDNFKIYDVNSMYPYVMSAYNHPIGDTFMVTDWITPHAAFMTVEGYNDNAFPTKDENGLLKFDLPYGIFNISIHEYRAAIELGRFQLVKLHKCISTAKWCNFCKYVEHFYGLRIEAGSAGDELLKLFYKLLLNNAYGKFAQDPSKYYDYIIKAPGQVPAEGIFSEINEKGWLPEWIHEYGTIWRRKTRSATGYHNVATGASITGAARAELMRGIHVAVRPVYCDTDSVICRSLAADQDPKRLGAWKLEAEGTVAAIAGKKMYAIFNDGQEVKKASKGVGLTALEILEVAKGNEIIYNPIVPTFKLDGTQTFISRRIRQT